MNLRISEIDWIAVIAATIVYCAFSGAWHRRFAFGKFWEDAMGFQRPEGWKETPAYFIVPSVSCFITSFGIALLFKPIGVNNLGEAVTLGLVLGIGVGTAVTFTNAVIPTMRKPLVFGTITGTAHAIGIVLATSVQFLLS